MSRGGYGGVTQRNPNQVPNIAAAGVESISQGHRIAYPYAKFPNGTGLMDVSIFPRQIPFPAPNPQCFYGIANSVVPNGATFPQYFPRFSPHAPFDPSMITMQPLVQSRPFEKRKRQPLPIIDPETHEAVEVMPPQKKEGSKAGTPSSSHPHYVPHYESRVSDSRIPSTEHVITQGFTSQRQFIPGFNITDIADTHDLQYAVMSSLSSGGNMTTAPSHTRPITTDSTPGTVVIKAMSNLDISNEEPKAKPLDVLKEQRKVDSAAVVPPTIDSSNDNLKQTEKDSTVEDRDTDGRVEVTREFTPTAKPEVKEHTAIRSMKEESKPFDINQGWLPSSMIKPSDARIDILESDDDEFDAFSSAEVNGETLNFYPSSANDNKIFGSENGEHETVTELEETTEKSKQVEAPSKSSKGDFEINQRFTYTRDFLFECYKNPMTKVKPPNLPNIAEILTKPHDNLDEMFKRTPTADFFRSGIQSRRKEMTRDSYRPYSRPVLHQSENPYTVKTAQQISELELSARKFRSLMNKITESNFENIMDHMNEIDLSCHEAINDILEIIFDKAVQEPKFTPIYARVCQRLAKTSKSTFVEKSYFKSELVKKVQMMFTEKITQTEAYSEKVQKINECQNPAEKKKMEEELEEIVRSRKRKGMGNVKFIGELFRAGLLTESIIDSCIRDLLSDQVIEWQYESLCVLLTNIGSSFSEEKINNIFAKLQNVLPDIDDNRIRFMILDLFDLRKANWVSRRDEMGRLKDVSKADYDNVKSSVYTAKHIPSPRSSELKYTSQTTDKGYRHSIQLVSPENLYLGRQDNMSSKNLGRRGTAYEAERTRKPDLSYAKVTARRSDSVQDVKKREDLTPRAYKGSISSSSDRFDDSNIEEFNDAVRAILESYNSLTNTKETIVRLVDLARNNATVWSNLINSAYQYVFDQRDDRRLELSEFLITMLNKDIPESCFIKGMGQFLSNADELSTDVPLLYKYLGESLAYLFKPQYVKRLKILKQLFKPILKTPQCSEVIGSMLESASKKYSNEVIKNAWDESELDLTFFIKDDELDEFCKRYKLQFLREETFFPQLYDELKDFFSEDSRSNEDIIKYIEANYTSDDIKNPKIMQPIITALAEVSIIAGDDSNIKTDDEYIKSRKALIITFTKHFPEFELEALNAITNYVTKIGSPFGVLQRFFHAFYESEIIAEETFLEWRMFEEQRDVHCTAYLSAHGFFEWLQQADTEE